MLSGSFKELLLDSIYNRLAITGEELYLIFRRLVRAQETVVGVESGAVYGSVEDLVETENNLGTCSLEDALCACTCVDITAEHVLCVGEDRLCIVCKNDLCLSTAFADEALVVCNVVNTGKGVLLVAKQFAILCKSEHVAIGIYALFVNGIKAYKMVSNLVRGVGEHQNDLFCTLCNAAQADGKTVAAEDGENNTNGLAAEFIFDVSSDIVNGCIVALSASNNCLGHSNDVSVAEGNTFNARSLQNGSGNDIHNVVAVSNNGSSYSARNSAEHTTHKKTTPFICKLGGHINKCDILLYHNTTHFAIFFAKKVEKI